MDREHGGKRQNPVAVIVPCSQSGFRTVFSPPSKASAAQIELSCNQEREGTAEITTLWQDRDILGTAQRIRAVASLESTFHPAG